MAKKKEKFEKEREIFLEHIQKAGLRRTGQRDLILDIFLRTEEHLTSEDLYWLVQKEDPTVGHTTVYRTLKLLTEAGLAREVRFGDNKTYYEHHYNHEHHDDMQDKMADKFGFKPTHHSLRMWGVCDECQKLTVEAHTMASGAQPRVRVRSGVAQ